MRSVEAKSVTARALAQPPQARIARFADNVRASLVVFLVALPLCMAIGLASGTTPAAGLLTGIVGGVVVGLLSGAPLQVSGPAAGLTVLIAELYANHQQDPHTIGVVVLLAGLMQLVCGLAGFGQWFRAVSPAVIEGMLAGIGVIIFSKQFHVLFDIQVPGGATAQFAALPATVVKTFTEGGQHLWAGGIGVASVVLMFLWKPLVPKPLDTIPAGLLVVFLAALAATIAPVDIDRVQVPANLLDAVKILEVPDFSLLAHGPVWGTAVVIALIASAETLLCATAVDSMHSGPRTNYNRELFAQGIGNAICGIIGALPMTGVIVRSAANVEAGGNDRSATILHGIWLLLMCAAVPTLLSKFPVCALAAILVYTGVRLVKIEAILNLYEMSPAEAAIYFVTMATIVATDLLTGVATGLVLSLMKLLYTISHLRIERETELNGRIVLRLEGNATFLRLPQLAAELQKLPAGGEVHIPMDGLHYVDHACLELLKQWEKQHRATGGRLSLDWDTLHERFRRQTPSAVNSAFASLSATRRSAPPVEN